MMSVKLATPGLLKIKVFWKIVTTRFPSMKLLTKVYPMPQIIL